MSNFKYKLLDVVGEEIPNKVKAAIMLGNAERLEEGTVIYPKSCAVVEITANIAGEDKTFCHYIVVDTEDNIYYTTSEYFFNDLDSAFDLVQDGILTVGEFTCQLKPVKSKNQMGNFYKALIK